MGNTASNPKTAGRSFSDLPLEIVLQVAESLPPESIAAMALMTSSLYECSDLRKMWKPAIERHPDNLVFLLARDAPHSVYCTFCRRLHRRRDTPKITSNWAKHQSCPRSPGMWLHYDPWNYHIQFQDVYDVMSRNRWGKLGDDISSIAVQTDWRVMTTTDLNALEGRSDLLGDLELNHGRCLGKFDVTPQITDGHLVLHTTQHMWYHPEMWEEMQAYGIGRHPFRHCKHWNPPTSEDDPDFLTPVSKRFCGDIWRCLDEFAMLRKTAKPNKSQHKNTWNSFCFRCSTAYRTDLWDHGKGGVEIQLNTYTDLGSCIMPTDIQWFTAAHHHNDVYDADYCREARYYVNSTPNGYYSTNSGKTVAYSAVGCASFNTALSELDDQGDVLGDHEMWRAVKRAHQSCSEKASQRHPRRLRAIWRDLRRE